VLIYFDSATKTEVLRRVRRVIRPDGFLFLGGAETTLGLDDGFERVSVGSTTAYRPKGAGPIDLPANPALAVAGVGVGVGAGLGAGVGAGARPAAPSPWPFSGLGQPLN
jgi:chemotaxis protein methyltransferase CheR